MVIIANGVARVTIDGGVFRDAVVWDIRSIDLIASGFHDGGPQCGDEDLALARYLCERLEASIVHHEPPEHVPGTVY